MSNPQSPVWSRPQFEARRTVDLLCRRFEEQWWSAQRVGIEDFIQPLPPEIRVALLPELVASEWELRCMAGGQPVRSDYCSRFPQLESLWSQLEAGVEESVAIAEPNASTQMLEVGDEFCGYKILAVLGQGGMGIVFLAEMPVIGHRVALKILASKLLHTPAGTVRFEREARLLSRLDHPGIVPLYSYGESGGTRYLVMKAITGCSLSKVIGGTMADQHTEPQSDANAMCVIARIQDRNAPERFDVVMDVARQLTRALKAVHDADILHRDIKPSNVMLSDSGQVFLTDFSLARVESASTELTLTNEFLGTLRYCAPESLDGVYSRQSDLYSLGLVLWELFTLVTPFSAPSRREMLNQKLNGGIPEMAPNAALIPPQLLSAIQRMTDCNPAMRFQSAEEILAALTQCENADRRQIRRAGIRTRAALLSAFTLVIVTMLHLWGLVDWHSASRMPPPSNSSVSQIVSTTGSELPTAPAKHLEPLSTGASDDPAAPRLIAEFRNGWLIPQQAWELPARRFSDLVSSAENDASLVVCVAGSDLLQGSIQSGRLEPLRSHGTHRVIELSQSANGQFVMIACQDNGRPDPRNESGVSRAASANQYFVETYSVFTKQWRRVGGPLCKVTRDLPYFLDGIPEDVSPAVLIPDSMSPAVWSPQTFGYWEMVWPKVSWTTVAMTYHPKLRTSVVQPNGRVLVGGFLWQPDGSAQDDTTLEIDTGLQNCTSLCFSPSTDHLIAMSQRGVCIAESNSGKIIAKNEGRLFATAQLQFSDEGEQLAFYTASEVRLFDLKTGTWIGQPLLSDNGILLASPLPKKASMLIVERSGAIRQLPVRSEARDPNVTTPSADLRELLQHTVALTAAAFRDSTGRLVVGTEDGRLVSLLVP